jgi:hypothetical protein
LLSKSEILCEKDRKKCGSLPRFYCSQRAAYTPRMRNRQKMVNCRLDLLKEKHRPGAFQLHCPLGNCRMSNSFIISAQLYVICSTFSPFDPELSSIVFISRHKGQNKLNQNNFNESALTTSRSHDARSLVR